MFDTEHLSFYVVSMSLFFAYTLLWTQFYEELQAEGYLVDYERVPVTDEKSPKETDFDALVSLMLTKLVRTFLWVTLAKHKARIVCFHSFPKVKMFSDLISFHLVFARYIT